MQNSKKLVLDYKGLVLQHISKIGELTALVPITQILDGGNIIQSTQGDKEKAFMLTVDFLESITLEEDKDEEFNKNYPQGDTSDLKIGMKKITCIMNLLNKKGYLKDRKGAFATTDEEGNQEIFEE